MYINGKAKKENTYDAIVIGSGISGGWAAKELCEKGLKTLVLERGRDVKHIKDYPTATLDPWQFPHRNIKTLEDLENYPIQSKVYHFGEDNKHFFVKDIENPYEQVKPFNWYRGYQVGGRSLLWNAHVYRWSNLDFEANGKEGIGVDWAIRYKDIAPWYDYVERFIGVSGQKEGIPHLPDGQFLPPFEMNCLEKHLKKSIESTFKDRHLTISRVAILTQSHNGRGECQSRSLCSRGCQFGAIFSSNSSTLPAAYKTGNLTMRPFSVVHKIIWDEEKNKAVGVEIIDTETLKTYEYYAKVIFVNASTLGTAQIMLQSKSDRFPNGFANDSGALGHYLMDHQSTAGGFAVYDGFQDTYFKGRRPAAVYVPRFQNLKGRDRDYKRGFAYQIYVGRGEWTSGIGGPGIGGDWKDGLSEPGGWSAYVEAYGECLPDYKNRVYLHETKKDKWGSPLLCIDMEYRENEKLMRKDMISSAVELLKSSNPASVAEIDSPSPPGSVIHEMGTARMGNDPKTSVLNNFNQCHAAPNVFVTDGACMASTACQNPSLTYMA